MFTDHEHRLEVYSTHLQPSNTRFSLFLYLLFFLSSYDIYIMNHINIFISFLEYFFSISETTPYNLFLYL